MNKLLLVTISVSAILATSVFSWPVFAYVMESSNFRLQEDSVNFGGGRGESDSFFMEDSAGEIGSGYSSSSDFVFNAGYQQTDNYISVSVPDTVALSPTIGGVTGGRATGQGDIVVKTDFGSGYSLYLSVTSSPALQSETDSFANYSPLSGAPDVNWAVSSTDSEFGFSPEGADIVQWYKDDGSVCNMGSSNSENTCWDYLSTTSRILSSSNGSNATGATTTIKFQAESGTDHLQLPGHYVATLVVTAVVN